MDTKIHFNGTTPHGYTIARLTNGSSVGLEGDATKQVQNAINTKGNITVYQTDGTIVIINGEHIVHAFYTPEQKEENNA
ncbi:hypothetical protein SEA_PSONYX_134 [Corynebacterium phage PSonyx]|nr:hypothetical protein SEA_PSONYX_134 [Corynebacterium phage PSonyx]